MMVFLLIAVCFMIKIEGQAIKTREVAVVYQETQKELYNDLVAEFSKDLPAWGAEITPDLAIRFSDPNVLFNTGKSDLKPRFAQILDEFFPRYVAIITKDQYKGSIEEIRVEGHTSSVWNGATSAEDAYFKNMELSQARTRSAVHYMMGLPTVSPNAAWLQSHIMANGLSSSHPILGADGLEDPVRSQRVEFRIRTDAQSKIMTIVENLTK